MKKIVIIGAGGFAREVKFLINEINNKKQEYTFLGYLVSDLNQLGDKDSRGEVLGDFSWLKNQKEKYYIAIGIGNPKTRFEIGNFLSKTFNNIEFPSIIHPNVIFDRASCLIEEGVIICASTILTVNVKLKKFCMLNLACTIGHEAEIGSGSVLNPTVNISGGVKIGDAVMIGTGVQILQYISVGNNAIVGAGACVTKNLSKNVIATGIPAREIKRHE